MKVDPPRNFDPECISCHVVGWNPEQFFPYVGGFRSEQETPQLKNTGCEDCHGSGQKHAAVEEGSNEALQKKLRKAVRLTKEEAKKAAVRHLPRHRQQPRLRLRQVFSA